MVREQVVRVDELSRHFGDKVAVDRVSFDIARSEVFGFLGPNGAGKTTDRKSTRLNSSHVASSYAVFCLKKKTAATPTKIGYISAAVVVPIFIDDIVALANELQ